MPNPAIRKPPTLHHKADESPTRGAHVKRLRIKEDVYKQNVKTNKKKGPESVQYIPNKKVEGPIKNKKLTYDYNQIELNDYMTKNYAYGSLIT